MAVSARWESHALPSCRDPNAQAWTPSPEKKIPVVHARLSAARRTSGADRHTDWPVGPLQQALFT